jgi:hypothetical protein
LRDALGAVASGCGSKPAIAGISSGGGSNPAAESWPADRTRLRFFAPPGTSVATISLRPTIILMGFHPRVAAMSTDAPSTHTSHAPMSPNQVRQ